MNAEELLSCVCTVEPFHTALGAGRAADNCSSLSDSSTTASPNHQESAKDIRLVIRSDMDLDAVSRVVGLLSNDRKHELIFNHQPQPPTFPSTFSHGCNRKFSPDWLDKYLWLCYSPSLDAVFCGICSVMLKPHEHSNKYALVNAPFKNWVKISDTLRNHAKLKYHLKCSADTDTLHCTFIAPSSRIDVLTDSKIQERIAENTHILKQIVRAILYLSKQGLGDTEDPSDGSKHNPGNFLALLKVFAADDQILRLHLQGLAIGGIVAKSWRQVNRKSANGVFLSATVLGRFIDL